MARYKPYSYAQGKFIPIQFASQILPGTFEFTLNYLVDHKLDLSVFDDRFQNDETGAPAYDPQILLKIILFAYSRGIVSSRKIAQACCENVIFMALSADTRPHFTTIANFIATMHREIVHLFLEVLLVCDEQGLIGKEMFAIDGCKLPSNASKEWSGTRADFQRKAKRMEKAIEVMVDRHHRSDLSGTERDIQAREEQYKKTLSKRLEKIRNWLNDNDDKPGSGGKPIKSNITDNESAKMKTSKGVIQGYDGVTAVDGHKQVIVAAEAFGKAQEHSLLEPMVEGIRDNLASIGNDDVLSTAQLLADSGFHTEANMRMLFESEIDAYVADRNFRKRDPRFSDAARHKGDQRKPALFKVGDFTFADDLSHCICPAGKRLYRNGHKFQLRHYQATKFTGPKSACLPCTLRRQCLRHPERTPTRQVVFIHGRATDGKATFTERMKHKIDGIVGRTLYGLRLAIGEPPFAHIRSTMRLDRFTLRTKQKVDTQWKLFCIVHNLKKVHRYGSGFA